MPQSQQPDEKKTNPNVNQKPSPRSDRSDTNGPRGANPNIPEEPNPRRPEHEHSEEIEEIRAPGRREYDQANFKKVRPETEI